MTMELSIKNFFGIKKNENQWERVESFDERWKDRIRQMSSYISPNARSIMDLGCGLMWLREFINDDCQYYGVDYVYRGEGSYLIDFNKKQFLEKNVDACFVSGCLEYVSDYRWFVKNISKFSNECILSYCTLDRFSNKKERRLLSWVNHLTDEELVNLFIQEGMKVIKKDITATNNSIYVFKHGNIQ